MHRLPNLTWLRTFEAAARFLNFTEAGRELGLTQTAVSQHMKALESALGCRLFTRKARGLDLTDLGKAYLPTVRQALSDIGRTTTSLFGPTAKQTIVVKLPISTAALWLAPLLPDFARAHPKINIRMVSNIWADSTLGEDVDVEIRLGHGDWPDAQALKVSTEAIVPVTASRSASQIRGPEDLDAGPLIHILGHDDNWRRYFAAAGIESDGTGHRFAVDTSIAALELVEAGGGHACVVARFAECAVRAGRAVAIVGEPVEFPQAHYLMRPATARRPRPEAALFEDWLLARFAEDAGASG
ncbi:LysR family transcriptional regulator [Defluviimonas salinarum]|uniref:LysR substrate-binding domain-containing protein n=1 Tax=Defluviimonas salinarum TaxID=2992147 RepID=A0ABT3J0Z2_9RHOB|nr:LysR family transcriptional regulator [Defluviimonas salinarum]MCW3781349.1 LysR substrate-binding domain-containing protein [Defluviimonas salinarum]